MDANNQNIGNLIIEDETIYTYGLNKKIRQLTLNDFRVSDDVWSDVWDMFEGVPVTEENLLKIEGISVTEDNDYKIDFGRKAFLICKAQENDWIILYREDIGFKYCNLRFVEFIHEIQNVIRSISDNELIFNL